jgi:ribosomal protein S18 acetylase RimI-like enzyme
MEAQIIQKHVCGGNLLDVGCDLGDLFEFFPRESWNRFGVELSATAAKYARETFNAEVHVGMIQNASLPRHSFNVITSLDTLYYIEDPSLEFEKYRTFLKESGVLAIEVSGQTYQLSRSRGLLCWIAEQRWTRLSTDSAYLFWPTPSGLERLLREGGFEPIAWNAIPSPEQPNSLSKLISESYFKLLTAACRRSFTALSLAPKYLVIARPSSRRCKQGLLQPADTRKEFVTRLGCREDVSDVSRLHLTHIAAERQRTDVPDFLDLYYRHLMAGRENALYVATAGDEVVGYANLVRSQRRILLRLFLRNPRSFLALAGKPLRTSDRIRSLLKKFSHEVLGGKWGTAGSKYRNAFELRSVVVAPTCRGRSIGPELLARCLEKASLLGARTVVAWIDEQNFSSQKLFLKVGFHKVAVNQEGGRGVGLYALNIERE